MSYIFRVGLIMGVRHLRLRSKRLILLVIFLIDDVRPFLSPSLTDVVFTYGDQSISGIKSFEDETYLNTAYVDNLLSVGPDGLLSVAGTGVINNFTAQGYALFDCDSIAFTSSFYFSCERVNFLDWSSSNNCPRFLRSVILNQGATVYNSNVFYRGTYPKIYESSSGGSAIGLRAFNSGYSFHLFTGSTSSSSTFQIGRGNGSQVIDPCIELLADGTWWDGEPKTRAVQIPGSLSVCAVPAGGGTSVYCRFQFSQEINPHDPGAGGPWWTLSQDLHNAYGFRWGRGQGGTFMIIEPYSGKYALWVFGQYKTWSPDIVAETGIKDPTPQDYLEWASSDALKPIYPLDVFISSEEKLLSYLEDPTISEERKSVYREQYNLYQELKKKYPNKNFREVFDVEFSKDISKCAIAAIRWALDAEQRLRVLEKKISEMSK